MINLIRVEWPIQVYICKWDTNRNTEVFFYFLFSSFTQYYIEILFSINWFWEQSWWIVSCVFGNILTSVFGFKQKCTKPFLGWHRYLLYKYFYSDNLWTSSCQECPWKNSVMPRLSIAVNQGCLMQVDAVSVQTAVSVSSLGTRRLLGCSRSLTGASQWSELFSLIQARCKRPQLLHLSNSSTFMPPLHVQ